MGVFAIRLKAVRDVGYTTVLDFPFFSTTVIVQCTDQTKKTFIEAKLGRAFRSDNSK